MTRTVLLTGFGPFPGVPMNASATLAHEMAAHAPRRLPRAADFAFHAETLPTEWDAGPARLAELHDRLEPAVVLHFGVSERAAGFVIETRGENACLDALDAAGRPPPHTLLSHSGPDARAATIPALPIVDRLRGEGFTAHASTDAGRYLCNAVLYRSLEWAAARSNSAHAVPAPRIGFVHIPHDPLAACAPRTPLNGALIILETCLAHLDRRDGRRAA